MIYEVIDFQELKGLKGFSDELLKNHFTLYEGYVNNTNKLIEKLSVLDKASPEFAELKRRFGWEWNGMRLHEYYFENLSKKPVKFSKDSELYEKIVEDFGSFDEWLSDFTSSGMIKGIGWVILYYDVSYDRLDNIWIEEHDKGHLADGLPLLVMDVFEHAYMLDYGIKRTDYIKSFTNAIDWEVVESRF